MDKQMVFRPTLSYKRISVHFSMMYMNSSQTLALSKVPAKDVPIIKVSPTETCWPD